MATILQATRPGHRCRNPFRGLTAADIRGGEMFARGDWILSYSYSQKAYKVWSIFTDTPDVYQFPNFNCAAAKLAELGGR